MSVGRACLARFQRCSFDRMPRNCSYTTMGAEVREDESYRRRDLNALFPQWQQRLQRR